MHSDYGVPFPRDPDEIINKIIEAITARKLGIEFYLTDTNQDKEKETIELKLMSFEDTFYSEEYNKQRSLRSKDRYLMEQEDVYSHDLRRNYREDIKDKVKREVEKRKRLEQEEKIKRTRENEERRKAALERIKKIQEEELAIKLEEEKKQQNILKVKELI